MICSNATLFSKGFRLFHNFNYLLGNRSNVTLFSKGFRLEPLPELHSVVFKRNPILKWI